VEVTNPGLLAFEVAVKALGVIFLVMQTKAFVEFATIAPQTLLQRVVAVLEPADFHVEAVNIKPDTMAAAKFRIDVRRANALVGFSAQPDLRRIAKVTIALQTLLASGQVSVGIGHDAGLFAVESPLVEEGQSLPRQPVSQPDLLPVSDLTLLRTHRRARNEPQANEAKANPGAE
jgi:hypothetical protein